MAVTEEFLPISRAAYVAEEGDAFALTGSSTAPPPAQRAARSVEERGGRRVTVMRL